MRQAWNDKVNKPGETQSMSVIGRDGSSDIPVVIVCTSYCVKIVVGRWYLVHPMWE